MDITRVLSLKGEEMQKLVEAGTLLGSIRDQKENFDEFEDQLGSLLNALREVLEDIKK